MISLWIQTPWDSGPTIRILNLVIGKHRKILEKIIETHTTNQAKIENNSAPPSAAPHGGGRFAPPPWVVVLVDISCVIFHTAADHNMDRSMHPPWSWLDVIQKSIAILVTVNHAKIRKVAKQVAVIDF